MQELFQTYQVLLPDADHLLEVHWIFFFSVQGSLLRPFGVREESRVCVKDHGLSSSSASATNSLMCSKSWNPFSTSLYFTEGFWEEHVHLTVLQKYNVSTMVTQCELLLQCYSNWVSRATVFSVNSDRLLHASDSLVFC